MQNLRRQLEDILDRELGSLAVRFSRTFREEENRIAFRLEDVKTEEPSDWSFWLLQDELNADTVREEIIRLIGHSGWQEPAVVRETEIFQPDVEQLLKVVGMAARESGLKCLRVVLASLEGEVKFLEVCLDRDFSAQLEEACHEGFFALGLLGWEVKAGELQARKLLFKWHTDARLKELFDRLCEAGVENLNRKMHNSPKNQ